MLEPKGLVGRISLLVVVAASLMVGSAAAWNDADAPKEEGTKKAPSKAAEDEKSEPSSPRMTNRGASADWPMFRGDPSGWGYRDIAISRAPRLKWTFDTASGVESTAAIVGDRVYVGTMDGAMLALDLRASDAKGRQIWKYQAEAGIQSSPSVHDGRVYFGDDFGFFYALDAKTGDQIWKYDTEGAEIVSSAVFYGQDVLFGSWDANLYALHAEKGSLSWKFETGGPINSTPAIEGNRTAVTGCDEILRVVNLDTRREDFQLEMKSYTAASPVLDKGKLFVGTFANEVIAVDLFARKPIWSYSHPRKKFPYASSAAFDGTRLVVGGRDKMVHCIDAAKGESIWTFPTKARVESSPVIARNIVMCGSSDKNLYWLDLANGKEIWRYESDGAFTASPALAHGRVVVGASNGLVYCFDVTPSTDDSRTESP